MCAKAGKPSSGDCFIHRHGGNHSKFRSEVWNECEIVDLLNVKIALLDALLGKPNLAAVVYIADSWEYVVNIKFNYWILGIYLMNYENTRWPQYPTYFTKHGQLSVD